MKNINAKHKGVNIINIKIGELVLNGFNPNGKNDFGEGLRTELERLFINSSFKNIINNVHSAGKKDAGSIAVTEGSKPVINGQKTARAVYRGIMNSIYSNKEF